MHCVASCERKGYKEEEGFQANRIALPPFLSFPPFYYLAEEDDAPLLSSTLTSSLFLPCTCFLPPSFALWWGRPLLSLSVFQSGLHLITLLPQQILLASPEQMLELLLLGRFGTYFISSEAIQLTHQNLMYLLLDLSPALFLQRTYVL